MKRAVLALALLSLAITAHAAPAPKTLSCGFKDNHELGLEPTVKFSEALTLDRNGPTEAYSATRSVRLSEGALTVTVSAYQPSGPDSYVKHDDIIVNVRDNKTGVTVISGGRGLVGPVETDTNSIFVNYGADVPGDSSRVGIKTTVHCRLQ